MNKLHQEFTFKKKNYFSGRWIRGKLKKNNNLPTACLKPTPEQLTVKFVCQKSNQYEKSTVQFQKNSEKFQFLLFKNFFMNLKRTTNFCFQNFQPQRLDCFNWKIRNSLSFTQLKRLDMGASPSKSKHASLLLEKCTELVSLQSIAVRCLSDFSSPHSLHRFLFEDKVHTWTAPVFFESKNIKDHPANIRKDNSWFFFKIFFKVRKMKIFCFSSSIIFESVSLLTNLKKLYVPWKLNGIQLLLSSEFSFLFSGLHFFNSILLFSVLRFFCSVLLFSVFSFSALFSNSLFYSVFFFLFF